MSIKKLSLITSLLFLVMFKCYAISVSPDQKLTITIDFESAFLITHLLEGHTVSDDQINQASAAYGSQQLIKKVKSYSSYGEDVFKATLKEVILTGSIKGEDPYNWIVVKQKLPQILNLLKNLAANEQAFSNDITTMIQAYSSDGIEGQVKACLLVGGGALGFTVGGDHTFNVALQKIGDDIVGLKYLAAHELYHIIQGIGQETRQKIDIKNIPVNIQASYALTYYLWTEGTANLVGDFTTIKNPQLFAKTQVEEYQKNADRKRENFYLFGSLLYKAYQDTSANYETLYNISFSTTFDETSYYVGYEMAKKIVFYEGNSALAGVLTNDPILFINEYIKLYKEHKDANFIKFDSATEDIVSSLMKWQNKIF